MLDYTTNPEKVIERSLLLTRNMYPDLPYERRSTEDRIRDVWKRKHFGCFEKAWATILAKNLSRSCTHQLVRHRLFSFSQVSMRRVEPNNLDSIVPPSIAENERAKELFDYSFDRCRTTYELIRELGIPQEDARFIIPMGIETQIEVTGNFRNWLHLLNMRTNPAAQWEIRDLAWECHKLLQSIAPNVFSDEYKEVWAYV